MIAINLIHLLVIFPFLIYLCKVVLDHMKLMPIQGLTKEHMYVLAGVVGLAILYHLSKVYKFINAYGFTGLVDKQLLMM